ncbi:hypothetical protein P691DRAFT_810586 [Macrolepiota fuliginosa MF-IS2]|uniref:Uncharacterized protein n=1 Tax=Macrolepiota fuliginosa MF-IS2 TaxID=1400762 RepID=A0A9P6C5Y2_9AGAR|nr:hypothetical protein P691DRAFT_810586 [Macrolepiota fuliginosa MF-IS2]
MAELWFRGLWVSLKMDTSFSQIPKDDRSKIIQSCKDRDRDMFAWEVKQKPSDVDWDRSYILGHGQHRCFLWCDPSDGTFTLRPYHECPPIEYPTVQHSTTDLPTLESLITELPTTDRQTTKYEAPDRTTTECPTTELSVPEHPLIEYPITQHPTIDCPSTECPTTELSIAESPTAECLTVECLDAERPVSNKTPRTLMQCIRFWRTPTFRRLFRRARSPLLGSRT